MTEDTGFTGVPEEPEVQPEPELPDVDADPQDVAGQAAAAGPDAAPPPLPAPAWLIDLRNQIGGSLLAFAEDVHRRLLNLGG